MTQHIDSRSGRWRLLLAGTALVSLIPTTTAKAQLPGFGVRNNITRPTTSPYLNLLRGNPDADAALNYYQLVRPEQQLRQYAGQLNQQVTGLRQELTDNGLLPTGVNPHFRATGHATSFLNLGSYFPLGATPGQRPVPRVR